MRPPMELSYLARGTGAPSSSKPLTMFTPPVYRTAKVWKKYSLLYDLKGHGQSVWAVLAVDENQFLTGM